MSMSQVAREDAALGQCCAGISSPLGREEAIGLAEMFKALADPARLQLLSLIKAQPNGECACNLIDVVQLSQPTVSYHLKVLHDAGLLQRRRQGSWVFYRVVPQRLEALAAALS
jgi:ArsR family transcriptional regulator, arsenate/arsenite/antimonite-responsive transcriptional repressor